MRRFVRFWRRLRYRLSFEPPAWAGNASTTDLEPLDVRLRYDLDMFRG